MRIPFLRPNPPRLSNLITELRAIEDSGIFTNFGPVNARLEHELIDTHFSGAGHAVTVCNATLGLMLSIRCVGRQPDGERARFALLPSFSFAATAQAALWSGYKLYFYDVDPVTWLPCPEVEESILRARADEIGVIVPYATFGACLPLARYLNYREKYGVPTVIDAAASLGTVDGEGDGFGSRFPLPIVFSMHATKTLASSEAGLVYAADEKVIKTIRAMANFGFGEPRIATMPGLNAKLSEVGALLALKKLDGFKDVVLHRAGLTDAYRSLLRGWGFQGKTGTVQAHQFMPTLVPRDISPMRDMLMEHLAKHGIGSGKYFSPHLRNHPFFEAGCRWEAMPVTEELSVRSLSLPLSDMMSLSEVEEVSSVLAAFRG